MGDVRTSEDPGGRLSQQEVAQLTEQLAGLSAAGLPLGSGLLALADEQPSRRLRSILVRLSRSLEMGAPLDVALESESGRLPKHLVGLVLAGLRTGQLGTVLGRFASFANFGTDLRRQMWISLLYPIISWGLATLLVGFLVVILGGSFGAIFKDFGIPLPVVTHAVVRLSELISESWKVLAGLVDFCVLSAIVLFLSLSASRRRSLVARIPLLGWVWRLTSLAEFCHLLALLLESEIALGEALIMTGDGVQDSDINRACRVMADDVESGCTLSQAVAQRGFFPRGLARILSWAEEHQSLPEALHMTGEMFEARAKAQAGVTVLICNVFTVILILGSVLLVIVSIFLPMIQLMRALF